jgi:OHCU decarboxylase
LARNPEAAAAINAAGWEIASHGLKWIDYRSFPPEIEAEHIAEAVRIQETVAGARPLGFYQGRTSEHTLRLTMAEGGFLYSADSYADELPYWVTGPNGRGGEGPFLIVPYTLDANDMRFATPQGFNSGDQFFAYLKDTFDTLHAEGVSAQKMMSIGLHCRLVGRPGRAAALARFLDYIQSKSHVWCATRLDIARHWAMNHPPAGGYKPSQLSEPLFMARFGGIYEHSPWVAARAYAKGLSSACDTAGGLHAAMDAAMREGSREDLLALIRAHPDLAGRLALAGELTVDSTVEQNSAGLDRLSAEELARFTTLNDAYKARFGFPFIMAVKGRSRDEIIAAFEARLQNGPEQEFARALDEISRITRLRLTDILPDA